MRLDASVRLEEVSQPRANYSLFPRRVAGGGRASTYLPGTALTPHSNEPLYSNTVIGTLAVDGLAVAFGAARRGLAQDPPGWPTPEP